MSNLRSLRVHYGLSSVLLGVYGTQVCPFIDSLSLFALASPILVTFVALYAIRVRLQRWLESRELRSLITTQFKIDLLVFIAGGLALASFNAIEHGFPVGSALKVILGMTVLGFFIASDLGLGREYQLAKELESSGEQLDIDKNPYPLTKKFGWFASICAGIVGAVVSLVIAKDLVWLIDLQDDQALKTAAILVFFEVSFVLMVMLAYILKIISSYGKNLTFFFSTQQITLNQVSDGKLAVRVPIASNDEFGVIARHTNHTIETLQARTSELDQMRDVTILALASLAETRDNETGAHILRTQQYVHILAKHLQHHPRFSATLSAEMIDLLYKSAPLHDAGKVGIPDAILLKPGRLTEDEYEIMKQHPMIGSQALQAAQAVLGKNSFLAVACEIMETHHEKWDGSGYPNGLKEETIPVSGRLMALADVYDALISERVYKPAFSHEKARDIIVDGRGSHFDPDVVDAFLELETEFRAIAAKMPKPSIQLPSAA